MQRVLQEKMSKGFSKYFIKKKVFCRVCAAKDFFRWSNAIFSLFSIFLIKIVSHLIVSNLFLSSVYIFFIEALIISLGISKEIILSL